MIRSPKTAIYFIGRYIIWEYINNNGEYRMSLREITSIDLPLLQSITLGWSALAGKNDNESCSLTMRSMNEVI